MSILDKNPLQRKDLPSWTFVLAGVAFGTSPIGAAVQEFLLIQNVEILVSLYTITVALYISTKIALDKNPELRLTLYRLYSKKSAQQEKLPAAKVPKIEEEKALQREEEDEDKEPQPIDLTGAYKLISNENFEAFLEVQGVPWALRRAACQARPIHRITHRGSVLTIKIESAINSQTTFTIDGPPVETVVRGRVFQDVVSYIDRGIVVKKTAVTEQYRVEVKRILSEDGKSIFMTSTFYPKDDEKEPIVSKQVFERIECE